MFRHAWAMGLEGIVSKRLTSRIGRVAAIARESGFASVAVMLEMARESRREH
jgi:hypothetical protein